jgi:SAM-dependent methyltransferase
VTDPFDSTRRFSNRVENYLRARPRYPRAALELLVRQIGLTPEWVIADVGSGTGFSSEPFVQNGNLVYGVEPNQEMRRAAEAHLDGYANFRSVDGTAEATGLEKGSIDGIVAGQAFHWFDAARAREEFRRLLKPDGWVVLMWNTRKTAANPFMQAYEELLNTHGTDYAQVRHRGHQVATGGTEGASESQISRFFGGSVARHVLDNEQRFDLEGVKSRLLSSSYTPAEGDPGYAPMLEHLAQIFAAHQQQGEVVFEYDLEIYLGQLG